MLENGGDDDDSIGLELQSQIACKSADARDDPLAALPFSKSKELKCMDVMDRTPTLTNQPQANPERFLPDSPREHSLHGVKFVVSVAVGRKNSIRLSCSPVIHLV